MSPPVSAGKRQGMASGSTVHGPWAVKAPMARSGRAARSGTGSDRLSCSTMSPQVPLVFRSTVEPGPPWLGGSAWAGGSALGGRVQSA